MKSGFTLLVLFFSAVAFTQDSSFQLKDYKYRTPGYKALAVNFNLSGGYSNSKMPSAEEASSRTLSLGPVAAWYSKFISTDTRQHQSTIGFSSPFSSSTYAYKQTKSTGSSFSPVFSWNRNDRFYRPGNWFFEVGNQLGAGYASQHSRDTSMQNTNHDLTISDNVTLGFGKGRIERVQDAQMALYLLQDLTAEGLLSRPFTAVEAYQLAEVITDINNRRVFDFRRRRKYELSRLDSFFRSSGLTPQTDIRHFTVINDNWTLAFNPNRLSGSNWYIRLQPGVNYNRNTGNSTRNFTTYESKIKATSFTLSPVIGYENYRPLSLKWQRNMGLSFSYSRYNYNREDEWISPGSPSKNSTDTSAWQSMAHAFYGIGYYPNNRTQITAILDMNGNYDKTRLFSLLSVFSLDVRYFLGYRTFLSASVNARHTIGTVKSNGKNEQAHLFLSDLGVSLSHVLF